MGRFSTLLAISSTAILIAWSSPCAMGWQLMAGPQFPRTLREATLSRSVPATPVTRSSPARPVAETLPKKNAVVAIKESPPTEYSILQYATAPRPVFPPARAAPLVTPSTTDEETNPGIEMQFGDAQQAASTRPAPLTNRYRKPERDVPGSDVASIRPVPVLDSSPFRQASTKSRVGEGNTGVEGDSTEEGPTSDSRLPRDVGRSTAEPAPVAIEITGPPQLTSQQTADWIINVSNYQNVPAGELLVRMYIPDGLTVTRFDRQAWLDQENRSVVFQIVDLPGSSRQEIRVQGRSQQPGTHLIRLELIDEHVVDATELDFEVVPGGDDGK